jgi:hypothetical protein
MFFDRTGLLLDRGYESCKLSKASYDSWNELNRRSSQRGTHVTYTLKHYFVGPTTHWIDSIVSKADFFSMLSRHLYSV